MKKQKIILITILILCAILSIAIIKQNTNIEKKTKVIKQMSESTQVTELNEQINQLNLSHTEYANSIQTAKKNLAIALTNEGIATTENDTLETMANNISKILQARTKDADATESDILEGKTAYVNGNKVIGTVAPFSSAIPFSVVGCKSSYADIGMGLQYSWGAFGIHDGNVVSGVLCKTTSEKIIYANDYYKITGLFSNNIARIRVYALKDFVGAILTIEQLINGTTDNIATKSISSGEIFESAPANSYGGLMVLIPKA